MADVDVASRQGGKGAVAGSGIRIKADISYPREGVQQGLKMDAIAAAEVNELDTHHVGG